MRRNFSSLIIPTDACSYIRKPFFQFLKRITGLFCHQAWSSPFILELLRGGKCPGLGQQRSL